MPTGDPWPGVHALARQWWNEVEQHVPANLFQYQIDLFEELAAADGVYQSTDGSVELNYELSYEPIAQLLTHNDLKDELKTLMFTKDVIVYRTENRLSDREKRIMRKKSIMAGAPKDALIIFMTHQELIDELDEDMMKEHGWVRVKKTRMLAEEEEPRVLDL